jgi:GT2 family glycosyltransferase
VLDTVGLLAEEYFFSFEDLDYCLRAERAGYSTWLEPGVAAYHEGSRSIGAASSNRLYYATRNQLLMAQQLSESDGRIHSLIRTAYIVALNLAHAARSPGGSLAERLRGVHDGIRDFRRGCYCGRE